MGRREGVSKGQQEGVAKGRQEGVIKGRQEGVSKRVSSKGDAREQKHANLQGCVAGVCGPCRMCVYS